MSLLYTYCQTRSISFQSVTMPCSIGYLIANNPRYSSAFGPAKKRISRPCQSLASCPCRHTDEDVALESAGHDTHVFRSSDEVREAAFGILIAREAGLDHAGTVVDHDRLIRNHVVGIHEIGAVLEHFHRPLTQSINVMERTSLYVTHAYET